MAHLVQRFREGRISVTDFEALQDWLASNPEVPAWRVVQALSEVHGGR